jgi:hypothetical protein
MSQTYTSPGQCERWEPGRRADQRPHHGSHVNQTLISQCARTQSQSMQFRKISKAKWLLWERTARKRPAFVSRPRFPHLSAIREVNLVAGSGKSPSVAAILLGRQQAEEIAKTRAPPHPVLAETRERSARVLYREMRANVLGWSLAQRSLCPIMEVCQTERRMSPQLHHATGKAFFIALRCSSIRPW